jgi:hypothetical protein
MHVLLALTLTLAALATAPQVEKLTQDGKADDAIEQGRAAVAAHPDDVDLRLALARALAAKARQSKRVINADLTKEDIERGEATLSGVDLKNAQTRASA